MALDREHPPPNHHSDKHSSPKMAESLVSQGLKKLFEITYALFSWFLFLFLALTSGNFFHKTTEQEHLQMKIARDNLWNLSKQPLPGFYHAFFKLRSGSKLHYICNQGGTKLATTSDLVVFLHGFPDSSLMWRHLLKEPGLPTDRATMVCVDLPGFGGSDSFVKYDTRVLEALTEFIVAMREKYTQPRNGEAEGNTFILGHDWGCVVVFRLAAEAPCLADRFVVSNGPLIDLGIANCERIVRSSAKIFKQFRAAPWKNRACLVKSYRSFKPLLWQMFLSGYVFAFRLPEIFVKALGSWGNGIFIKSVMKNQHGKSMEEYKASESLAASLGPGIDECSTETTKSNSSPESESYGPSVLDRARSPGAAFWQQTAYYRDNLAYDKWDKSIEAITDLYNIDSDMSSPDSSHRRRSSSASSALFSEQYKGSLRAPTTILWGEDDIALSKTICLDGIGDYLAKGSEVILLPRAGHWTAIERESRGLWAKTIRSLIGKNQATPNYLFDSVKDTYEGAQLLLRR